MNALSLCTYLLTSTLAVLTITPREQPKKENRHAYQTTRQGHDLPMSELRQVGRRKKQARMTKASAWFDGEA